MKVICISKCQKDRKIIYETGKEYEITEEMYQKNKQFFEQKIKSGKKVE